MEEKQEVAISPNFIFSGVPHPKATVILGQGDSSSLLHFFFGGEVK